MRGSSRNLLACAGLCCLVVPAIVRAVPTVGDVPPPLHIKEWVQGEPVDLARDAGKKVYMVEFWATWCPPCKASVPLLSGYQEKYAADLTIIGVTDPDTDRGNTPSAIRRFVRRQGDKMNYTVAMDDASRTFNAYFDPMAPVAIPQAFLVGRQGKIVWVGSPLDEALEEVIPAVIEGTYDLDAAKVEAEVSRRLEALNLSAQMGQWGVVWEGLMDILRLDPDNEAAMKAVVDIYSLELRNTGTFRRWVRGHIDAHGNNSRAMRNLAGTLLGISDLSTRVPDLALEAASRAYDRLKTKDSAAVAVYAQALYNIGKLDGAIEKQEEAIALANVDERKALRGTLEYYHLCKRLQGTLN